MKIITGSLIVLPEKEPIFCEAATTISIEDEAAGPFVVVSQCTDKNSGKIEINPNEWPYIREAIDGMLEVCKEVANDQTAD